MEAERVTVRVPYGSRVCLAVVPYLIKRMVVLA